MMEKFSIITSVYKNDDPKFLKVALDSMLEHQTIKPYEIVLVQDGPVPTEISQLLIDYKNRFINIFNIIKLEKNAGLGNALKLGVENAKCEFIARMDSDDICLPNRFEKQLKYLKEHPEYDIIGGQMTEFIDTPNNIVGRRIVPLTNKDIYNYMKNRCALNHVTVMFRKEAVLKAGNYQDWFWNEDYYLWIRMMMMKCKFANLPDILVNVRTGSDQYARRGGRKYYESEKGIKKLQLDNKMISKREYCYFLIQRYVVQILMPNWLRGWVFRKLARKR